MEAYALSCPTCSARFHAACVETSPTCPDCLHEFEESAPLVAAEDGPGETGAYARGRRLVIATVLLVLVPRLIDLAIGPRFPWEILLVLAILAGFFFSGSRIAGWILGLAHAILAVAFTAGAARQIRDGRPDQAFALALSALFAAPVVWLTIASSGVALHLHVKRLPRSDP